MEYNREWEYGTPVDCDCENNFIQVDCGCKQKDVCECENILLEISKLKSEDVVLQREIDTISGASISGVTEEEVDAKIASAKTEIEAEIPSLSGYATEQWVEDKHYITGVDLSNYATTEQMNEAISAATDGLATEEYVNTQISSQTSDFVTGEQLSSYTYDKATIDEKIAGGGIFDPTQYYTTAQTVNLVESAVTRVEGEIPTVPTSNTAFTNDAGYITGVDLSNYATKDNLTAATDDMATKTWVNNQGYLTEHQSLTAYSTTQEVNTMINQSVSGKQDTLSAGTNITIVDNVISAQGGGATYTAGVGIDITNNVISAVIKFWCGTMSEYEQISQPDNNTIYLIHS